MLFSNIVNNIITNKDYRRPLLNSTNLRQTSKLGKGSSMETERASCCRCNKYVENVVMMLVLAPQPHPPSLENQWLTR